MESIYMKGHGGKNKASKWCSREILLKDRLGQYLEEINKVLTRPRLSVEEIFKQVLPDSEDLSKTDMRRLKEDLNPKQFKTYALSTHGKRNKDHPCTSKDNNSSTSKQPLPSTSCEGLVSTLEQQPLPSVSQQPLPSTSREGLVSTLEQQPLPSVSQQPLPSTSCEGLVSTLEQQPLPSVSQQPLPSTSREGLVSTLEQQTSPSTSKQNLPSTSWEGLPSTLEDFDDYSNDCWGTIDIINENTNDVALAGAGSPAPNNLSTKPKNNPRKRNRRKCGGENVSNLKSTVQSNEASSEAVKVVTQLLESILSNLNYDSSMSVIDYLPKNDPNDFNTDSTASAECYDFKNKPTLKIKDLVDYHQIEESKLDSMVVSDLKEHMLTSVENPEFVDPTKFPRRRSSRLQNKEKREDKRSKTEEIIENKELVIADKFNDSSSLSPSEVVSERPFEETWQFYQEKIKAITKRGGRNQMKNPIIRGLINVDTTRRLGKKDLKRWNHFVVSFRVHKPFKFIIGEKGRPGKCQQEITALNFQTLADVRDKILCEADYQDTAGNVSDYPFAPVKVLSNEKYKSGMFYFNNTFYVDTREDGGDYSVVIKEWAEPRGIKLGATLPMEEMAIEDLEVKFGYPYVYIHQGSCEHLIIISNARLLNAKDSLHSSDYPCTTKISRSQMIYCGVCCKKPANWNVRDSDQMFSDSCYLCQECFYSFHYVNGKRVGKFKAYRFKQRAILFY